MGNIDPWANVLATKVNELRSISRIQMMEEENSFHQIFLHGCTEAHLYIHIKNGQIFFLKKVVINVKS